MFMRTRGILGKSRGKGQGIQSGGKKPLFWGGHCLFIEGIREIVKFKQTDSIT